MTGWKRRRRNPACEEVASELEFHLEMRTREYMEGGLDRDAARAEAIRRFGDVPDVARVCTGIAQRRNLMVRARALLAGMRQDLAYAGRVLRRAPGFTAVVVVTLGLGIGATTSVFSVVSGVLLRPLAFPQPERLVVIESTDGGGVFNVTAVDFAEWLHADVFEHAALYRTTQVDLVGDDQPERLTIGQATGGFFPALGVSPLLGTLHDASEFEPGAATSLVLSHEVWRRRFGGRPDLPGTMVRIAGRTVRIAGVLPPGLGYPADAQAWLPLQMRTAEPDPDEVDNYAWASLARLHEGVSLEEARTRVRVIGQRIVRANPGERDGVSQIVTRLDEWQVGAELRRMLWVLMAAVGFVLLIGCFNVAHLLLSRSAVRTREMALRGALGAGRGRLVRQMLTESVVIGIMGGALGVLLADAGTRVLVRLAPASVSRLGDVSMDAGALAFAIGLSVLAALGFGVAPALRAWKQDAGAALGEGSQRLTGNKRRRRGRDLLIALELAISLILLMGAGLMVRTMLALRSVNPGFEAGSIITFTLALPAARYPDDTHLAGFREILERIRAVPGVDDAALSGSLPLRAGGFYLGRAFLHEGRPEPPAGAELIANWIPVSPGYFGTLAVPLLRGRDFSDADGSRTPPVMIVTRAFAEEMFGSVEAALGQRVRSWRDENVYREIVGIVQDIAFRGPESPRARIVHVPHAQSSWGIMTVVVRTQIGGAAVAPALRGAVAAVDPDVALAGMATMNDALASLLAPRRFVMQLLILFAAIAVTLAAIGLYGVLSRLVVSRRREIGVRMALGARQAEVVGMILRDAGAMIALGLAVGLAGALLLTRTLRALLFGVEAADPVTLALACTLLAATAILASWLPARRASRIDPAVTIRAG